VYGRTGRALHAPAGGRRPRPDARDAQRPGVACSCGPAAPPLASNGRSHPPSRHVREVQGSCATCFRRTDARGSTWANLHLRRRLLMEHLQEPSAALDRKASYPEACVCHRPRLPDGTAGCSTSFKAPPARPCGAFFPLASITWTAHTLLQQAARRAAPAVLLGELHVRAHTQ
jgi:hypothetical protein